MEKKTENYIRFDWAMKRLLRNKANFDVLEGFLSSLFGKTVKIQGLLESEGNREREDDKANRVDLLALMDTKEKVIIEVQNNTETAYFQRMIFGTSKVLCDYINKGENYEHVSKVYSVNIVYFALGKGTDYVYHGKTEFRGIHNIPSASSSPNTISSRSTTSTRWPKAPSRNGFTISRRGRCPKTPPRRDWTRCVSCCASTE